MAGLATSQEVSTKMSIEEQIDDLTRHISVVERMLGIADEAEKHPEPQAVVSRLHEKLMRLNQKMGRIVGNLSELAPQKVSEGMKEEVR